MTPRERVYRTLTFAGPDRAPRDLWVLPGVAMQRADAYARMLEQFPLDMEIPEHRYGPAVRCQGTPNVVGTYVDEWGCTWTVAEPGVIGEVKQPPLADWSAFDGFSAPWELLDQADFSKVNAACAATGRFTRAGNALRTFERIQFLRGTENTFMDLLDRPAEFDALLELITEYNVRELDLWLATGVDAVNLMDDWGAQHNLLIDPEVWRKVFKPVYARLCERAKAAGKFVFFHSDGHIRAILGDLIDVGVDAINAQLFCMDIEELGRTFKGKITFWGEIDRQFVLPFGTVDDVRAAVRRVRRALDDGRGGLFAQCEWGLNDPEENIAAVFTSWLESVPG